jgi:glycosyltransferase involved in cell wall biosynthesis
LGFQEQDLTRKTVSGCHRKKFESCLVEIAPETARVNAHSTVKILFLNQFFYPDLAPSGKLILDVARHLASKGDQVTVLCGSTLYAEAEDTQAAKNNLDGIRVIRVPSTNFGRTHRWLRALDDLGFLFMSFLTSMIMSRHDIVISRWSPPVLPILVAWLKRFGKARCLTWVHDLYPEVAVSLGLLKKDGMLCKLLETLSKIVYRNSDIIICITEQIRNAVVQKGVPFEKTRVVPDWIDETEIYPETRENNLTLRENEMLQRFVLLYSGNFGLGHDFSTFLESARMLLKRDEIRFLFVGGGPRKAEVLEFIERNQLTTCRVVPYRSWESLRDGLNAGDVHLISMRDGLESCMFPSKVYASLACGKPFIFVGPKTSEVLSIIERSGAGFFIPLGEPQQLIDLVLKLRQRTSELNVMGQKGRKFFEAHFTQKLAMERFDKILNFQ